MNTTRGNAQADATVGERNSTRAIVDAVRRLTLARTQAEVQEIVIGAARSLCNADGATFVLRVGQETHYVAEDALGPLWNRQRFPLRACVAGWAMLERRTILVRDVHEDQRPVVQGYRATFARSMAVVPVDQQRPVAALGCYWARPYSPSAEELSWLNMLAEATAVALDNVRRWGAAEQRVAADSALLARALEQNEAAIASLAHELRNTLGTSRNLVQLVLDDPESSVDEELREDLRLAHEGMTSGLRLVEEQLSQARDRTSELGRDPELVEVGQILGDLARTYRSMHLGTTVRIVADPVDPRVAIYTDRHLLTQALRNLVSNALKFTDVGEVRLGAELDELSGHVTISVADTGIGIAPADRARVFERFAQVMEAQPGRPQGTGLGLAYVRGVVDQLGGRMSLQSAPGAGSTFQITLPGLPPQR